ncbi:MAG: hypothetical protein HY270_18245 [Deltaproteobacteria bacterium]|nr:hypothetical protein [Deltaproteobacteria bacterium]
MWRRGTNDGSSLVELVIALGLLSVIALAVTSTILTCAQARSLSERWMTATTLAMEGIEQMRAGRALAPIPKPTLFTRTASVPMSTGLTHLQRIDVEVSWDDGQKHSLRLSTLVYDPSLAAH